MATGVQQPEHIACTSCGRKFRYKIELAGRTVKCPCGSAILVPKPAPVAAAAGEEADPFANVDWGEYDLAEPAQAPPKAATPVRAPAAPAASPAVGLAAAPGAADEPMPGPAVAVPPAVQANLPPMRKGLKAEERKTNEELVPPSTLRDFVLPSILIVVGIVLRFYEVMSDQATKNPVPFDIALGTVATKIALSVGLMLGGMFLAIQILDVSFIGALPRTAYKLIGIAIGPGALYGILSHTGGDEYGSIIATFASVAVYALLFWIIMRLDGKDTAVCVTMTWILVTAANYIGYKVEGMMKDSWV